MRPCHSNFLLFTCVTYLSVAASLATTGLKNVAPVFAASNSESLYIAQATAPTATEQLPLQIGSRGAAVRALQTQLNQLGYYDGAINAQYDKSTQSAVSQFQTAVGLEADGIVGSTTQNRLQAVRAVQNRFQAVKAKKTNTSQASTTFQRSNVASREWHSWVTLLLVLVGVLGAVGGLVYLLRWFGKVGERKPKLLSERVSSTERQGESNNVPPGKFDSNAANTRLQTGNNGYNSSVSSAPETDSTQGETAQQPIDVLGVEQTTRLAKLNIVEELINELQSPNRTKRQMAIWDLGQRGDSRAIQPLVDLMVDSDSQECSLILAAITEIGSRTLKPINRALAISLQNENAEVRKNALRDVTRIYDLMFQMSQMLYHTVEDPDADVRETAQWALRQMNRNRVLPDQESRPGGKNSVTPEPPLGKRDDLRDSDV